MTDHMTSPFMALWVFFYLNTSCEGNGVSVALLPDSVCLTRNIRVLVACGFGTEPFIY